MAPEKKKLFQHVNMLHMKPITYNIKNMLISDMYSQNQNVQYREVQITNIFSQKSEKHQQNLTIETYIPLYS